MATGAGKVAATGGLEIRIAAAAEVGTVPTSTTPVELSSLSVSESSPPIRRLSILLIFPFLF